MKLGENWFVDAPWAQLLCSTKIPDDILLRFVEMSDGAEDAIAALNDAEVEGRKLVVNESKPRESR